MVKRLFIEITLNVVSICMPSHDFLQVLALYISYLYEPAAELRNKPADTLFYMFVP
jgi:hypothetical protein